MTNGQVMAGEMAEQPDVLARLAGRAAEVRSSLAGVVPGNLAACVIVARGSSDHAALLGQYLLEAATGRPVALASPSLHTLYRVPVDYRGVLVVGVSQSGATSEIVEVVSDLGAARARTVAITNDPSSPLAEAVGSFIDLGAGPELAVPATKTVTATLLAFVLLAEGLSGRSLVAASDLADLPGHIADVLADEAPVDGWRPGSRMSASSSVRGPRLPSGGGPGDGPETPRDVGHPGRGLVGRRPAPWPGRRRRRPRPRPQLARRRPGGRRYRAPGGRTGWPGRHCAAHQRRPRRRPPPSPPCPRRWPTSGLWYAAST